MKWIKYRLKTTTAAEDLVSAALMEAGVQGVEIEDRQPLSEDELAQMFVDIPPQFGTDDGIAYLSFYLEPDEDQEAILAKVRAALDELRDFMEIGEGSIVRSETEDKDWVNNWKQYFKQFYVDDILVIPSWETVKPEDADKMILHIDPGTAFGTGMHETTQLCIRALKKYVKPGMRILDAGTGSGILSIAALKLGADYACGTDLDPCAVEAVTDNKQANEIAPEDFDLIIGNLIDDPEVRREAGFAQYDIVAANILADVLVPMTPAVVPAMKDGAVYITSGILEGQEQKVIDACKEAGLTVLEVNQQGEWMSVVAQKRYTHA